MHLKKFFFLAVGILVFGCALKQKPTEVEPAPIASPKKEVPAQSAAQAGPLTREKAYEKLLVFFLKGESRRGFKASDKEFSITLPSNKPQKNMKDEWQNSYVTVFFKKPEKVDQVAVVTMNCKAASDKNHQTEIQERMLSLVKSISNSLWGEGFEFNKSVYYKELGPRFPKESSVRIRETFAPAQTMGLSRGLYKCDGTGGYGLRYDFFLK